MKIEVKDLCYRAGGKEILDHVTVTFEGNCICGIIGPNGSGKTTLLRHIYRELPSHGRIYMDGTEISEIPRRVYLSTTSPLPPTLARSLMLATIPLLSTLIRRPLASVTGR